MQAEHLRANRRMRISGLSGAAVTLALAILPAGASAGVVAPHVVTPTVVTPHALTSPTRTASAPTPTASAPTRAAAPSLSPGHDSGGWEDDPTSPEGLPDHFDPNCDIACKKEWYDWFNDKYADAWTKSLEWGQTPEAAKDLEEAAKLFHDELEAIGGEIMGGGETPGEEPGETQGGNQTPGGDLGGTRGDGGGGSDVDGSPGRAPIGPPDAISGDGPIIANGMGSWNGVEIGEEISFAGGGAIIGAIIEMFLGPPDAPSLGPAVPTVPNVSGLQPSRPGCGEDKPGEDGVTFCVK
jgi:hypothetical protein